jgi:hypothetical protein
MHRQFCMPRTALLVGTLPAVLSALLFVGCEQTMTPEDAQKHSETQKAAMQKGEEEANALNKKNTGGKGAPTVKLGTKPGAVGKSG